jgi:hypothetical protein
VTTLSRPWLRAWPSGRPRAHTRAVDVRAVLVDAAALGPFFTIGTGAAPGRAGAAAERPLAALRADPAPLRDRIAHVRGALGTDDRVAASLAFQGLAAQLVSAPYAAAVRHGAVPALTPESLHLRHSTGTGPGWTLRTDAAELVGADQLPAVLAGLLVPLVAAVRAHTSVAERLLWGNAASTVAAAQRLLVVRHPDAAGRAADVAGQVLSTPPLAGAGDLLAPRGPDRVWTFRRRSCCLYYRVPGGGLCDDCVLSPAGRPPPSP